MIVVVVITVATGALLLWALYTEEVAPPARPVYAPAWTGLPDPAQIVRRDFPVALGGYEPAAVDAHLQAVARAYATLQDHAAALAAPDVPDAEGTPPPEEPHQPEGAAPADMPPPAPPPPVRG